MLRFERPARELKGAEWQYVSGTSGTILALGLALRARNPSDTRNRTGSFVAVESRNRCDGPATTGARSAASARNVRTSSWRAAVFLKAQCAPSESIACARVTGLYVRE
jgi:hypothetical protein